MKVTALAAIILGAFLLGHGSLSHITERGVVERGGLARAVASVFWTYDGWIAVSMIAGEVVAPERLMKRIIIIGMLVIVTLYIGANLAYLYMMPVGVMAQQKEAIARTVMTEIAGPAAGVVILLAIMTSVFGALNGNLLAKPRVAYAMARDGLTFSFLGKIHPAMVHTVGGAPDPGRGRDHHGPRAQGFRYAHDLLRGRRVGSVDLCCRSGDRPATEDGRRRPGPFARRDIRGCRSSS